MPKVTFKEELEQFCNYDIVETADETGSLKKTQEGSESSRHDDFVDVIDEVHDHLIVESQEDQDSRISEEIVSPSNHDTQQVAKNDNVDFSMLPIKVDIIENTEEVGECTSEVRGQSYEEVKAKYFEVFETIYLISGCMRMKIRSGATGDLPNKDVFSMFSRRYKKWAHLHWTYNDHTTPSEWSLLLFDSQPREDELRQITENLSANHVDSWQQIYLSEITEIYLELAPSAAFRVYRGAEVIQFSPMPHSTVAAAEWADAIYSALQLQMRDRNELRHFRDMFLRELDAGLSQTEPQGNLEPAELESEEKTHNEKGEEEESSRGEPLESEQLIQSSEEEEEKEKEPAVGQKKARRGTMRQLLRKLKEVSLFGAKKGSTEASKVRGLSSPPRSSSPTPSAVSASSGEDETAAARECLEVKGESEVTPPVLTIEDLLARRKEVMPFYDANQSDSASDASSAEKRIEPVAGETYRPRSFRKTAASTNASLYPVLEDSQAAECDNLNPILSLRLQRKEPLVEEALPQCAPEVERVPPPLLGRRSVLDAILASPVRELPLEEEEEAKDYANGSLFATKSKGKTVSFELHGDGSGRSGQGSGSNQVLDEEVYLMSPYQPKHDLHGAVTWYGVNTSTTKTVHLAGRPNDTATKVERHVKSPPTTGKKLSGNKQSGLRAYTSARERASPDNKHGSERLEDKLRRILTSPSSATSHGNRKGSPLSSEKRAPSPTEKPPPRLTKATPLSADPGARPKEGSQRRLLLREQSPSPLGYVDVDDSVARLEWSDKRIAGYDALSFSEATTGRGLRMSQGETSVLQQSLDGAEEVKGYITHASSSHPLPAVASTVAVAVAEESEPPIASTSEYIYDFESSRHSVVPSTVTTSTLGSLSSSLYSFSEIDWNGSERGRAPRRQSQKRAENTREEAAEDRDYFTLHALWNNSHILCTTTYSPELSSFLKIEHRDAQATPSLKIFLQDILNVDVDENGTGLFRIVYAALENPVDAEAGGFIPNHSRTRKRKNKGALGVTAAIPPVLTERTMILKATSIEHLRPWLERLKHYRHLDIAS